MKTEITIEAVTPDILRAGVESNETAKHLATQFTLADNGRVNYFVKFWDGWTFVENISLEDLHWYMRSDSGEGTIWTTPIEEGK